MFKFCFVTDDKLTPLSKLDNYLKIIFESKVDCIQLRFKNLKTIDLYNLGKDLKKDCVKFKKTLIVNDRVDIAKSINAHGAHVGMDDLPYNQARKILGRKSIIGVSASNKNEFIKVKKLKGVDYIGVSAFSSNTKKDMKNYFGLSGLKNCANATKIPLIAIGGINISDVNSILKLKIHGVAMISSLLKGNIKKNCIDVSKIISCLLYTSPSPRDPE